METKENELVYAQDEPNISELIKEYEQCSPFAQGWNRIRDNEDTRFSRWDGQSSDGKKHDQDDKEAFPWNGASDAQVFLADAVINENVAVLVVAFLRSVALAKGVEPKDFEQAANITKLLEWLTGTKMNEELMCEVELSAQYREMYGNFVLHPTWERQIDLQMEPVTLAKLAEISQQAEPGSPMSMLPQLIAMEETEDQAVALVQEMGARMAQTLAAAQLNGDEMGLFENYKVKTKRARKFVRELREGEQSALPIPYICKNQPSIKTLKLWEEVFVPPYVTDLQKAPMIFVKHLYTEQELRSKAALEDWDQDWVDQAVAQAGRLSTWTISNATETSVTTISGSDSSNFTWLEPEDTRNRLIEVLYAYTSELDEDDVPCIYYTICHANITKTADGTKPLYAKRDKLGYAHKEMPFIMGPRERWNRSITSSRGVPQMLASRQRELKVQRDSLVDSTSIGTIPPVNIPSTANGSDYKFGPATRNVVTPGREPKFMEIQMRESPAFELMDRFKQEVKEEMGILSEDVPPARVQVKQQMMVNSFLNPWTKAFQQVFALVQQYMPDQMYMEITGADQPLPKGAAISLQKDFILTFDVREMDVEHILKEFKAIAENVLPHDREGVISAAKLVRVMLRAVNPALAKEITLDGNQASQQLYQRVNEDFMAMFTGNQPRLMPDDNPTAQAEINIAQQILQTNQKYQQAFMTDMDFNEKVKTWFENRQFNMMQNNNKQTGRVGVEQAA